MVGKDNCTESAAGVHLIEDYTVLAAVKDAVRRGEDE
jgi:hypothetical protein